MKTTGIVDGIYWVGAVDWDLRDFHGYATEKGSSYNAYLVKADKTVLFDTVKADFQDDLIANIKDVCELGSIDYIVVNHAEMDHSGALPGIIELAKPEKVICTSECEKALRAHFPNVKWDLTTVKDGDSVNVGGRTIRFVGTPMLHWPESMASFIPEDNVLISNDIFGQHWATSERFDDEVDQGELFLQAAKYYANIFLPTSGAARKLLKKLDQQEIHPDMLLVDHGLIWRNRVPDILDKYRNWSDGVSDPTALIIYDTMWGSTSKMARAMGRGLAGDGVSVKLFDLRYNHRSDVMTEVLTARALILGSPVLNKTILPKMADMLSYMKALKPFNKIGSAFGSYGWSDTSTKQLIQALEDLKIEVVDSGISSHYVPDTNVLDECEKFGERMKAEILKRGFEG